MRFMRDLVIKTSGIIDLRRMWSVKYISELMVLMLLSTLPL